MSDPGEVTRLLGQLGEGGREALDRLLPILYEELRRLAHGQMRRERSDHTLDTTGLVHEAYLKLVGLDRMGWKNRAQFFAVASQAMRRVLVDYAIARRAQKRGGGWNRVPLDEEVLMAEKRADEVIALDDALRDLARRNERHARIVECHFFGGMTIEETAEALGVSPATVKRDWALARAWLNRELSR